MWSEPILHVDMDSFFVEVERLDNPSLVGRPVAVGGTGGRGVIASASYEARSFGVASAQPTSVALRLCPQLVVVSPAHGKYDELSNKVFAIFRDVTPAVEGLSLDEAFLDVSGLRRHYGSPVAVATEIRERLRSELSLPASVGVASNKFVAKLASEAAKPDGLRHIPATSQRDFVHSLEVGSLWGVGPATLAGLKRLGIETVAELAMTPRQTLVASLGPSQAAHLHDLANGVDERRVEATAGAKSVSVEETYASDLQGRDMVEAAIMSHSQRLASRLRRAGLAPRTISLKIRFADFSTLSRSHTFGHGVDQARELYAAGVALLDQVPSSGPVRLLGLGGSNFVGPGTAGQLHIEDDDAWHRMGEAIAQVQDKFGTDSVTPARLIDQAESRTSSDE